jgi:hypothetical protein
MATRKSTTPPKAKPSRPTPTRPAAATNAPRTGVAGMHESASVLEEACLLLMLGARALSNSAVDDFEIHAAVRSARRTVEQYMEKQGKDIDDDRVFQALGLLVVLDRSLDKGLDMEVTSLVDPLGKSLEAAGELLDAAAQALLDEANAELRLAKADARKAA